MPAATPEPALYVPFRQDPQRMSDILAHTRVAPASLGEAFRRTVQSLDKDLPVRDVAPLGDRLAMMLWPLRVFGGLFAIFAVVALLLASVGLYAVVAQAVNQCTHELGVRVALGASSSAILRMVFAQGMRQMAIGLAVGLADYSRDAEGGGAADGHTDRHLTHSLGEHHAQNGDRSGRRPRRPLPQHASSPGGARRRLTHRPRHLRRCSPGPDRGRSQDQGYSAEGEGVGG